MKTKYTFTTKRTGRMESYRGKWYTEVKEGKYWMHTAVGDTAAEAEAAAKRWAAAH